MRRNARSLTLLVLAVLVAGCAAREADAERGPGREGAVVEVRNQSWLDMRIFAQAGGQRVRLGTVTANTTQRLDIPADLVGIGRDMVFVADAIAGGEARSFNTYVRPGESVTITIPSTVR